MTAKQLIQQWKQDCKPAWATVQGRKTMPKDLAFSKYLKERRKNKNENNNN